MRHRTRNAEVAVHCQCVGLIIGQWLHGAAVIANPPLIRIRHEIRSSSDLLAAFATPASLHDFRRTYETWLGRMNDQLRETP